MCGIFGIIGSEKITEKALQGLHKLKYRGYDSAGLAYQKGKDIKVVKAVGEIENLEIKTFQEKVDPACVLAHTRWATHGKVSVENAHPHLSKEKIFALVHNGNIENYLSLKKQYLNNTEFKSETDSEVIVQLLEKFYEGDTLQAFNKVVKLLKGSFAIAIINKFEPNVIYATKVNNPLVVGQAQKTKEVVLSSDVLAITSYTNKPIIIEDKVFVKLFDKCINFFDESLKQIFPKAVSVKNEDKQSDKGNFKHFMLKEIFETPSCVDKLLKSYSNKDKILKILPEEFLKKLNKINFIACGTAYHAGCVGKNLFERLLKIQVESHIASEFVYSEKEIDKEALYVFVTQSGETADTLLALKKVKENRGKTLALVNVKNSKITFESDFVLYTVAGEEVGIASTKAYINQVALIYLLAFITLEIKQQVKFENTYQKSLKEIREVFNVDFNQFKKQAKQLAKRHASVSKIFLIGRQLDYISAKEGALKIKEITYLPCEAYPSGELKHGPISLVDKNSLVICFDTQACVSEKNLAIIDEVTNRGANVIVISKFTHHNKQGQSLVPVPTFKDIFMPLISIVPLQMFAYYLSLEVGNNPDKPRNLAKAVTV